MDLKFNISQKNILDTLDRLCRIKSTSGTVEEASAASEIYSFLSEFPYFKVYKDNLTLHEIEGDPFHRKYISALYESGSTKKTVILLSHFDVVGIEEFGALSRYAYTPSEYTKALKDENIPTHAKADLVSGDWLFGRGTMDMKCGLAIHMEILRYAYENNIDGNILLLTVPDEENSSGGMLSAVKYISHLKSMGYNFCGAINSEPYMQESNEDNNKYIYTGTIGKLLPFVFSAGLEAHAVEPFAGLSSSLVSSMITSYIEGNTELCETYGKYTAPPPVTLKQYDIKPLYSVSTPSYSYAYYNYFTLHSSPEDVLNNIRNICSGALDDVIKKMQNNMESYASSNNIKIGKLNFSPLIMTYNELIKLLDERNIELGPIHEKYTNSVMDTRDMTAAIVMDMLKYVPDLRPVIVIGFAPPYYPHRISGRNHQNILDACFKVIERSMKLHGESLIHRDVFPGLCDLSYLGFENPSEYLALKNNMPLFGSKYSLPTEVMSSMDIGCMNIGVMGRDPHKYTERLNIPYSTKVTPDLVLFAVKELLSIRT